MVGVQACRGGWLSAYLEPVANPVAIRRAAARPYENNTDNLTLLSTRLIPITFVSFREVRGQIPLNTLKQRDANIP